MPGVITRKLPWLIQPQYPVELASGLPVGTLAYIGAQRRLLGGTYVESGAITLSVTKGGRAVSGGTTASYINAGKTIHAQPGAHTVVFQFIALDSVQRYVQGNVSTGTAYIEDIRINSNASELTSAGRIAVQFRSVSGGIQLHGFVDASLFVPGDLVTVAARLVSATEMEIWVNGVSQAVTYGAAGPYTANTSLSEFPLDLLNRNVRGVHSVGTGVDLLLWARIPSNALDLRNLTSSPSAPWQIFPPIQRKIWVASAGGGADLAGNAAAQAAAQAALSVAVPLAGAGITVATTTGAVSVSINPSGDAKAQANSTGGLSVSVPFTAAALVSALAAAGLSVDKSLSGSGAGEAMAAAGLSLGKGLSGSGAGEAGSAATISLNVSLAGSPVAEAVATGSLGVVGDGLQGAATVSPSAQGNVSLAVGLSGASFAVSGGIGNLTQLVAVSGSAASASFATGGLDIAVNLNAAALVEALAAATLSVTNSGIDLTGNAGAEASAPGTITLRINLDGAALAAAIAAGALTTDGLIVAGTPGYKVTRTPRSWQVTRTPRSWQVTRTPRSWKASA